MKYFYHTNNKDAALAYPHYSDATFSASGGAIIYGFESDDLQWIYADRLRQWKPEKAKELDAALNQKYEHIFCAARIEEFLGGIYGRPVELKCIRSGVEVFSGYPWYAYGYVFKSSENE